ncbi:MAG: phosphate ABC transporter permease PstA [Anaerolineae bacterium]
MKSRWRVRRLGEGLLQGLMLLSLLLVGGSLLAIVATLLARGLPALTLDMLTRVPKGGYYLGKEGGILNAILGSLYLAAGATALALALGLPIALYLRVYARTARIAGLVRLAMDALWGVPSIVYGAFGFTLMAWLGLRASLLAGILVLALLELPILTRTADQILRLLPDELEEAAYAVGATRLEAALTVVLRQALPGLVTATLLAFGRGIGDAASVLFTAGYTDRLPEGLLRPVASLPLAIFFQLGTPYPEVQQRAYAAALVLTVIVLATSLLSRLLARRLGHHTVH